MIERIHQKVPVVEISVDLNPQQDFSVEELDTWLTGEAEMPMALRSRIVLYGIRQGVDVSGNPLPFPISDADLETWLASAPTAILTDEQKQKLKNGLAASLANETPQNLHDFLATGIVQQAAGPK